MKKIAVIAGIALLMVLAAQCKKKQDVAADKAAVKNLVANDKELVQLQHYDRFHPRHDLCPARTGHDALLVARHSDP